MSVHLFCLETFLSRHRQQQLLPGQFCSFVAPIRHLRMRSTSVRLFWIRSRLHVWPTVNLLEGTADLLVLGSTYKTTWKPALRSFASLCKYVAIEIPNPDVLPDFECDMCSQSGLSSWTANPSPISAGIRLVPTTGKSISCVLFASPPCQGLASDDRHKKFSPQTSS